MGYQAPCPPLAHAAFRPDSSRPAAPDRGTLLSRRSRRGAAHCFEAITSRLVGDAIGPRRERSSAWAVPSLLLLVRRESPERRRAHACFSQGNAEESGSISAGLRPVSRLGPWAKRLAVDPATASHSPTADRVHGAHRGARARVVVRSPESDGPRQGKRAIAASVALVHDGANGCGNDGCGGRSRGHRRDCGGCRGRLWRVKARHIWWG